MSTKENSQRQNFIKTRILITGMVTLLIIGLLLWQNFHGGVPGHHILNRADLPEISNWWGGLLLPILTWLLLSKIENRVSKQASQTQGTRNQNIRIFGLFLLGLIFGIVLAASFTNDYKLFLDNALYILILLSLMVPIYYSEFILGFILGMTYTFGAVLPTLFILIIEAFGFLIYRFIRPLLLKATKVFRK
jgi:hypothetical protein